MSWPRTDAVRSFQMKRLVPPGVFILIWAAGALCFHREPAGPGTAGSIPALLPELAPRGRFPSEPWSPCPQPHAPPQSGDPRRSPRACGSQNRSIGYKRLTIRHRLPRMKTPSWGPKPKHSGLAASARGSRISACLPKLSHIDGQARA
jgi:hypothetical protein